MSRARANDGSAGDVDYGEIGASYAQYRQPEPAIAAQILDALGNARTVLNVGAGSGSYEPPGRQVTAVEPSASMRAQRPGSLTPAIDATAEELPFADDSFDASMAIVTVHQWSDLEQGLAEMRRVTRGPVVLLVADPALLANYWLNDYIPEVRAVEASRFPSTRNTATCARSRSSTGRCALSLQTPTSGDRGERWHAPWVACHQGLRCSGNPSTYSSSSTGRSAGGKTELGLERYWREAGVAPDYRKS